MKRRTAIILLAACAATAVAGAAARLSSAAFTAQTPVAGNTVTVDKLGNYFQVTPGTAVQAGTSTPVATGNVDTLALAFSLVPSARAFTSVFTVKNISTQSRTAVLTLNGPAQVVSAVFASTGTTSATLAAGASTTVTVTTSSTVAGHGVGSLRLGLSSLSWMYRTYALTIDEAPEAPPSLTASQRPAGRIDLAWGASSTTTGLRGYDVYRKTGAGSYAKLNASPLTGLTYSDTATDERDDLHLQGQRRLDRRDTAHEPRQPGRRPRRPTRRLRPGRPPSPRAPTSRPPPSRSTSLSPSARSRPTRSPSRSATARTRSPARRPRAPARAP